MKSTFLFLFFFTLLFSLGAHADDASWSWFNQGPSGGQIYFGSDNVWGISGQSGVGVRSAVGGGEPMDLRWAIFGPS